jgi:hypothetical protein
MPDALGAPHASWAPAIRPLTRPLALPGALLRTADGVLPSVHAAALPLPALDADAWRARFLDGAEAVGEDVAHAFRMLREDPVAFFSGRCCSTGCLFRERYAPGSVLAEGLEAARQRFAALRDDEEGPRRRTRAQKRRLSPEYAAAAALWRVGAGAVLCEQAREYVLGSGS